jgi:hypothetical protein
MPYTITDIISAVKRKGSFPTSSTDLFSTSDFLDFAYDELLSTIVPLLSEINEDYFLEYLDITPTVGQSTYRMPSRSSSIRDIQIVTSSGEVNSLRRLWEEDRTSIDDNQTGYFIKGNQIIISPTPKTSADKIRIVYVRRPSKYVATSSCAQIISITGNTIVVSALPTTMTNGTLIDFCQSKNPYDILLMSEPIASSSGTTLTFANVPSDLIVGDFICLQSESCVPGIQEELVTLLVQAILCSCLLSKKDSQANIEIQKLEQMKDTALDLLSPRVKSAENKILNRNSLLSHFRRF